jgi:hypothetical protein
MSRELAIGASDLVLRDRGRTLGREAFDAEDGSLQAALRRLLPQGSSAPITVRLAANHARMLLLPWLPQLTRPERWLSLAASRFEQTFGEGVDGWVLRVVEDLPPRVGLAAAVPEALLESLRALARLRSVRVGLLDALGALLEREAAFSGCVAQVGRDSACLMMLWRGELRRIRTRRFDAVEELSAAARTEWIAACGAESKADAAAVALAVLGQHGGAAQHLSAAIGCSRLLDLSIAEGPNR